MFMKNSRSKSRGVVRDGATLERKPPSTVKQQSGKFETTEKYHSEAGEEQNTGEI